MTQFESYEVSDADFVAACKNAPYWAKKRCLKKMQKVIYNYGFKHDAKNDKWFPVVNTRPPKDVEEYVKGFCWRYRDEGQAGQDQKHAQQCSHL